MHVCDIVTWHHYRAGPIKSTLRRLLNHLWKNFIHTSLKNSCCMSAALEEWGKDSDNLFSFLHLHPKITQRKKMIIIKSAIKKKFICAQFVTLGNVRGFQSHDYNLIWVIIMKKRIFLRTHAPPLKLNYFLETLRESLRLYLQTIKNEHYGKLQKSISLHFEYCVYKKIVSQIFCTFLNYIDATL